jgi:hypothetical protein
MPGHVSKSSAIVGVSDHGGWAVLVSAAHDGTLLDRRRVELVARGLPRIPHHSECQGLPIEEGVELVERVRESAEKHAARALDAVSTDVPHIVGVALRRLRQLPETIAERITNYRAQNVADWVMYRTALASAAEERGWHVHWYDAKSVLSPASQVHRIRQTVGPPWTNDHKLAMAAAIAAHNVMRGETGMRSQTESAGIAEYAGRQAPEPGAVCDRLQAEIEKALPDAAGRIWHGGPVWFIGDNPVVGYSVRSGRVDLMFWSGQLFDEPSLKPTGKDKAAQIGIQGSSDVKPADLRRWLKKAGTIVFDYAGAYAQKRAAAAGSMPRKAAK